MTLRVARKVEGVSAPERRGAVLAMSACHCFPRWELVLVCGDASSAKATSWPSLRPDSEDPDDGVLRDVSQADQRRARRNAHGQLRDTVSTDHQEVFPPHWSQAEGTIEYEEEERRGDPNQGGLQIALTGSDGHRSQEPQEQRVSARPTKLPATGPYSLAKIQIASPQCWTGILCDEECPAPGCPRLLGPLGRSPTARWGIGQGGHESPSSCLAITRRWISLVPS